MRRALFVWAILSLIGLGCWGLVDSEDVPSRSSTGSSGGELADASDTSTTGDSADGSSQDAAPEGPETCDSPVGGQFNCCNGKPCRGWCEPNGDCNCGVVSGGCSAPTVCCLGGDICVSEAVCSGDGTSYDGPTYDGGTDCAPPSDNPYEDQSCCEGVPCWGNCELHDGAWQCSCNGILEGCGQFGLTCCWSMGCAPEGTCGFDD